MSADIIKIEALVARAAGTEILKGINLSVKAGEFVALVGPNGAGKTTLLRHINGLRKPCSGRVIIGGTDTRSARTSQLAKSVGFLFQNPDNQIISNRVHDEIRFGLKHTGIPHSEWKNRIHEAAASVGLEYLLDSDPFTLSRSMRQRVALASVLALHPGILVLDEPTSAQDEESAVRIMETARKLNAGGVTVILVSHDMELVARYAGRTLAMLNGQIAADRTVHDFFHDDALLKQVGLSKPGAYRIASALGLSVRSSGPLTPDSIALAVEAVLTGVRS